MRIAVVGARGQLGAAVVQQCRHHEVVAFDRAGLDVTDEGQVRDTLSAMPLDIASLPNSRREIAIPATS